MKNKLIILFVSLALIAGILYIGGKKEKEQEMETPNLPVGEIVDNTPKTPAPIVPENPEGEADPKVMKLDMKTWVWQSALYNDGTTITPKSPEKFTLTFAKDGTFSASTDCNGVGGDYATAGNQIIFKDMMGTLMFCEGSQENDFKKILENSSSFFFTSKGELILEQKFDSGTATFR